MKRPSGEKRTEKDWIGLIAMIAAALLLGTPGIIDAWKRLSTDSVCTTDAGPRCAQWDSNKQLSWTGT